MDVRFLGQFVPDKQIPQFAARFYWRQVLPAGVKVYQYTKGMMHSKVVMVDGELRIATVRERLRRAQERVRKYIPAGVSLADECGTARGSET